jgi:hypothetical protein
MSCSSNSHFASAACGARRCSMWTRCSLWRGEAGFTEADLLQPVALVVPIQHWRKYSAGFVSAGTVANFFGWCKINALWLLSVRLR